MIQKVGFKKILSKKESFCKSIKLLDFLNAERPIETLKRIAAATVFCWKQN